ncbi:hypothetical protein QAD02_003896 [Eretmocerus hayati]|uniref:Uncharacterized protein n=1 Tax=Eretmocerus hayati TaxID=131215 RepID=A0ACC2NNF1_9HYME|nr:hypothetical protein QAD02_003896 [Eretmocerus hayati]
MNEKNDQIAAAQSKQRETYEAVGSGLCRYKDRDIPIGECHRLCKDVLAGKQKYEPTGIRQNGACWCQWGVEGTPTLKAARLEDLEKKYEKEDKKMLQNLGKKSYVLKKGYHNSHDKKYISGKKLETTSLLEDSD